MTSRSMCIYTGLTALSVALVAGPVRADYTFVNFDGPGSNGFMTTVNAINNNGAVVGFSTDANAVNTNFVRNPDGSFTNLSVVNNASTAAMANGINDNNTVVGGIGTNAFLLANNYAILVNLPQPNPGNTISEVAFGINASGAIVGQYVDNVTDTTPGFVFANNKFTILVPGANTTVTNAQSINNDGQVVGFYSADGVHQHGFLYNTTTQSTTFLPDPTGPNVTNLVLTQFLGINDHNMAVGYWQDTAGSQHGFLFNIETFLHGGNPYTFLDDPATAAFNGVTVTQITGINNASEITGFYMDGNGNTHGFVATVPEPGSMTLLGLGLVGLFGYSARRRLQKKVAVA
jgi:probable HAF family extracellular repeat protein